MVTHAIDFLHLTDRICVLKDGKIQAFGTFSELQNDPHLQSVLEINKKNLEESKQAQQNALLASSTPQALLMQSEDIRQSQVSENSRATMNMSQKKINMSTRLMDSRYSKDSSILKDSVIKVTGQDTIIEEEV